MLGTGQINLKNLPATSYKIDVAAFNTLTSKEVFQLLGVAVPSFGKQARLTLSKTGIVAEVNLLAKGSVYVTASGFTTDVVVTPTYKWPNGLFDLVQLSGNGQNNFISCNSHDLSIRQRAQYPGYNDQYSTSQLVYGTPETIAADTAYTFAQQIQIPVALNMTTLTGALFAQSDSTNLQLVLTTAVASDLIGLSGGTTPTVALTDASGNAPTLTVNETIFSIPIDPQNGALIIPDLSVLHGYVANDTAVAGQSNPQSFLLKETAKLIRMTFEETYPGATNAVPLSDFTEFKLVYGANTLPYDYLPADELVIANNVWYQRLLDPTAAGVAQDVAQFCMDFAAENASRDTLSLAGLTNLRMQAVHASGFVPNTAAQIHLVQEILYQ